MPPERGNMLADTYNTANKLVGVTKGTSSIVYAYSGLGNRLKQIADGVTTDYTLDINAGLTQVLQDNTNKYVYGNTRISQIAETQTGYFLPDALGSMRQMTDPSADLTLAQTYDPYGNVVSSSGVGETVYGYTGEIQSGGLVHLRARDYASQLGRFLSRDTWEGNYLETLSLNKWNYVEGNPIKFIDPSGRIKQGKEDNDAEGIRNRLNVMNIIIYKDWGSYQYFNNSYNPKARGCGWNEGSWEIRDLELIEDAATRLNKVLHGKIPTIAGRIDVRKSIVDINLGAMAAPGLLKYVFGDIFFFSASSQTTEEWYKYAFVHEFGHVWDYKTGNMISRGLMNELGTLISYNIDDPLSMAVRYEWEPYHPTVSNGTTTYPEPPPDTISVCLGSQNNFPPSPNNSILECRKYPYSSTYGAVPLYAGTEDWATALGNYVIPEVQGKTIGLDPNSIRRKYVEKQISNLQ